MAPRLELPTTNLSRHSGDSGQQHLSRAEEDLVEEASLVKTQTLQLVEDFLDSRPKLRHLDRRALHSVNQQPRILLAKTLIPHSEPPRPSSQQEQRALEERQHSPAGDCSGAAPQLSLSPSQEDSLEVINSKLEVLERQRLHLDNNKILELHQLSDKQTLLVDHHSAPRRRPRTARVTPSSSQPPALTP